MDAFLLSLGVIFLAELGDKSQLMALAFATRYRALTVLAAVTVATLLVHGGSVVIGHAAALALPTAAIQVVAGPSFLGLPPWTMRGDPLSRDEAGPATRTGGWALVTIRTAVLLSARGAKKTAAAGRPAPPSRRGTSRTCSPRDRNRAPGARLRGVAVPRAEAPCAAARGGIASPGSGARPRTMPGCAAATGSRRCRGLRRGRD